MCGCGTSRPCWGGCPCGCDHDTLEGARRQVEHFALQAKTWRDLAAMWKSRAEELSDE